MQVDPQLQKLTALIEEKRAAQASQAQRPVGRPGNPKFAEAARRVQLARQGRTTSPGEMTAHARSASTVENTAKTTRTKQTSSSSKILMSGDDRLTKVRPFGHLYNAATPEPAKGASAPHLGRNFDSYA